SVDKLAEIKLMLAPKAITANSPKTRNANSFLFMIYLQEHIFQFFNLILSPPHIRLENNTLFYGCHYGYGGLQVKQKR
ncbi:MAG TPA: hypothetical protein DG355_05705, partial [Candidatus Cloacimonas sp.]|nr:hypothetical protein [Candidatus Cloacimonas sp.]